MLVSSDTPRDQYQIHGDAVDAKTLVYIKPVTHQYLAFAWRVVSNYTSPDARRARA
jgi:hypothetical protein